MTLNKKLVKVIIITHDVLILRAVYFFLATQSLFQIFIS